MSQCVLSTDKRAIERTKNNEASHTIWFMEKLSEIVRKNLIGYREAQGLSQNELARRAKVDPSTISMFERGLRELNIKTLEKLANALKVPAPVMMMEAQPGEYHNILRIVRSLQGLPLDKQEIIVEDAEMRRYFMEASPASRNKVRA